MSGTSSQIELASEIKARAGEEFDRVEKAFREVADRQSGEDRDSINEVIAILQEKRAAVMGNERAGYFITEWQELSGRIRQIIAEDPRYQAIKNCREARKRPSAPAAGSEV